LARHPADGSEIDDANADASGLLAEVEALRRRLVALEQRLPGNIPEEPAGRQAKRRASTKTVLCLTTGAMLAILAGASIVYGQSAVDALFITKEGNVAIGPSGALFVGKEGKVAIGPSRLDPNNNYKLHVSTSEAKTSTNGGAGFAVTTNEAGNPFGLGIRLTGAPGLADRSAVLITTDVNLGDGGHLVLQPSPGNVGIGTMTPKAENKLEVNGQIAANSLSVAGSAGMTTLTVTGSAGVTTLNVDGDATIKQMSTSDQGVKIQGTSGRNEFKDSEKKGALRVGAAYGIPGIWSEQGDVIVGSQSGNIQLSGKPNVSGDIYQRDDNPPTTYEKPLWRYHMSLTAEKYAGRTKTIPKEVLTKLCGTRDGCEVRLGMTRWDDASKTQTASIVNRFYYSPNDGHWRVSWPRDTEGIIGNGATQHAMDAWSTCFFTDGTYNNYQDLGDKGTGMQLGMIGRGNSNPARTCELTLIP
jgi:hypothetical protein